MVRTCAEAVLRCVSVDSLAPVAIGLVLWALAATFHRRRRQKPQQPAGKFEAVPRHIAVIMDGNRRYGSREFGTMIMRANRRSTLV